MTFKTRAPSDPVQYTIKLTGEDVYVRSMSGQSRLNHIFIPTSKSKETTVDIPAEQYVVMCANACAECVLGEDMKPLGDFAYWYEQRPDVMHELMTPIQKVSGLDMKANEAAKKNLNGTTKSAPYSESADESDGATQTACEPNLAAVS